MQTTTLSFTNLHNYGELFANFFRARRQSFIIQRNWDLPQVDGMEFDQYDTPQSRWVAVHDGGKVLAGMRLTPTTASCGIYSYMIRDAQRGILGGSIPQDLLYGEAPVDDHTWEATRLFVSHDTPQSIRRRVHAQLVDTMVSCARGVGAKKLEAYGVAFLEVIAGAQPDMHPARRKLAGRPEGDLADRLEAAQAALLRGADGTGKPMSCSRAMLAAVAKARPRDGAGLERILGAGRAERFGEAFLAEIAAS